MSDTSVNTTTPTLAQEMQAVVDNLKHRDWIQGAMKRGEAVCAHGAVQTCQGLRPGDEHILRAVMRTHGITEGWNDDDGRTKEEVLSRMSAIGATDQDLAETFGPSWALVVQVIRRAALLTPEEATALDAAWAAAWAATRDAAWAAALDAAWAATRDAARDAALDAALDAAVADLIGQHGFTQEHFDTLMKPWTTVLGTDWAESVK